MFCSPGRVFFTVFGFPIYYYGFIMGVALLVAITLAAYISKKFYENKFPIIDIAPLVLLLGILGARLYYCMTDFRFYVKNPVEIFAFRDGGLSIHGAILFGIIALLIEAKRKHVNFGNLCDIFSIALPFAQSIGRWGNFFNNEAFGLPTNLPWKLYIPFEYRPEQYLKYKYFHPTFLYESICDLIIFLILYLLRNKYKDKPGTLTAIYLILYSAVRIFVESLRIDCTQYIFGLALPIFVSIIIILLAATYLITRNKIKSAK